MKTYSPKASEITRQWHVIDASGEPVGRLASRVALLLRGKHKPTYAPHMDMGDHVIVVNAAKVTFTGGKTEQKRYYRHSGYPGGFKAEAAKDVLARFPDRVVERAVKGMLPHTTLGKQMYRKLRVYAGPTHPHAGQIADNARPRTSKKREVVRSTTDVDNTTREGVDTTREGVDTTREVVYTTRPAAPSSQEEATQ